MLLHCPFCTWGKGPGKQGCLVLRMGGITLVCATLTNAGINCYHHHNNNYTHTHKHTHTYTYSDTHTHTHTHIPKGLSMKYITKWSRTACTSTCLLYTSPSPRD